MMLTDIALAYIDKRVARRVYERAVAQEAPRRAPGIRDRVQRAHGARGQVDLSGPR